MAAASAPGQTPHEQVPLDKLLEGKQVLLREARVGSHLHFDREGRSGDKPGIRGLDDLLLVNRARVEDRTLVIEADRMQEFYDFAKKTRGAARVGDGVRLEIKLADRSPVELSRALRDVFVNSDEVPRCSDLAYLDHYKGFWEKLRAPSEKTMPAAPEEICFPTGYKAYKGGKSEHFEPARPLKAVQPVTRDRSRTQPAPMVLAVRIDEKGRISDAIVMKSITQGFDKAAIKALRKWKIAPAKLDGAVMPGFMVVEMNFHQFFVRQTPDGRRR